MVVGAWLVTKLLGLRLQSCCLQDAGQINVCAHTVPASACAGAVTCYTAHLLAACMNTSRSIRTYPDIGQAAFGQAGRIFVSVLLYMELFSCCVDFMILEADNLAAVFPDARLSLGAFHLSAKQVRWTIEGALLAPFRCSTIAWRGSPWGSRAKTLCL